MDDGRTVEDVGLDAGEPPRAQRALQSMAGWVSRRSYAVMAVWLCLVGAAMVGCSRQKLLWNDEVMNKWVFTLPTARAVWRALKLGTALYPPFVPLLGHWVTHLLGPSPLVLRLPCMVGVGVMLMCLFLTLRRYIGPLYALLGLVIPFCTVLPAYGYDATPYGIMYGFLGAAIYCWDKAGDRDRSWWNVAFGLAVAAMLGCHFYALFALPAFYLAEGVRTLRRGVNWWTTGALVAASASELLYLPLVIGIRGRFLGVYWSTPHWGSIPRMLAGTMNGLAVPLYVFLLLAAALVALRFRFTPREYKDQANGRFRELTALAFGLLLVPLLGWLAGMLVFKAFVHRYVQHGLFGVFLLVPLFAARHFRADRSLGLALLVACGLPASLSVARGVAGDFKPPARHDDFAQLEQALPKLSGDIVVSNFLVFTPLVDYSPALRARCIYFWDREKELQYTGQDMLAYGAPALAQLGFFRGEPWSSYHDRDKAFLFLAAADSVPDGVGEWLRAYMKASDRYGEVVLRAGSLLIVRAKPVKSGIAP
jgi:hypothetical protein